LSEILYPLYEAVQVIPEDEDDKHKVHERVKKLYDKWDSMVRNDYLARGLPEPDHDQPWEPQEEEPAAAEP